MTRGHLTIAGLQKAFGGLIALNNVSFEVDAGTILGLIGVNGSGKTTLMNCLSGLYKADAGTATLDGVQLIGRSTHAIAREGVGRTFQVPRVFRRMTLVDNLLVPTLARSESNAELETKAEAVLEEVQLGDLRFNYAGELSGGQQKLLELARLMMLDPKLILLDEPFAGVNPTLSQQLTGHIERLRDQGVSFVLVSHDMTSIYRLSRDVVVLNQGEVIATGSVDQVRSDPKVIEAYLGSAA